MLAIGIVEHEQDTLESFKQIVPELLIVCFIMLNEIKLKLLGLYWTSELDVETVNEGILRTMCKGNEEEVERRKQDESSMDLDKYFRTKQ